MSQPGSERVAAEPARPATVEEASALLAAASSEGRRLRIGRDLSTERLHQPDADQHDERERPHVEILAREFAQLAVYRAAALLQQVAGTVGERAHSEQLVLLRVAV